jgi:hypothetical protein
VIPQPVDTIGTFTDSCVSQVGILNQMISTTRGQNQTAVYLYCQAASTAGFSNLYGGCDAIAAIGTLLGASVVPYECQLTSWVVLSHAATCNITTAALNAAITSFSQGQSLNGVTYQPPTLPPSSPAPTTSPLEHILIVGYPARVLKRNTSHVTFNVTAAYSTTRSDGAVTIMAVMPGAERSTYLGGTTLRPTGLAGQGSVTLAITLGSWVRDSNQTLQLWLTTSSWAERFASTAPVTIEVVNTPTGDEHVEVTSGPTDVTRVGTSGPTLDITVVYTAATDVDMVPVVRNNYTSLKYLRNFEVLSTTGRVTVTAVLRLHLGSWADAGQGYNVEVTLLRRGEGWSSRFARSAPHLFSISNAPGAAVGSVAVGAMNDDENDEIVATTSPDGSVTQPSESSAANSVATATLATVALLCAAVAVGVATRWKYLRTRGQTTAVVASMSQEASGEASAVTTIGEIFV